MRDARLTLTSTLTMAGFLALAGCGGGGSGGGGTAPAPGTDALRAASTPDAAGGASSPGSVSSPAAAGGGAAAPNGAPAVSGAPPTAVTANEDYVFQPVATDPEGQALSFSAEQLPAWAGLDRDTGRIFGRPRPADQGVHGPVVLAVSDGTHTVSLPAFTISVGPPAAGQGAGRRGITLTWRAPERNADGSPIGRPPTYRIHYGRESRAYDREVELRSPGASRYTFTDLEPGNWFLAMTAVGADGIESEYSEETRAVVN